LFIISIFISGLKENTSGTNELSISMRQYFPKSDGKKSKSIGDMWTIGKRAGQPHRATDV
jgi:hypothetical protein